MSYIKLSKSEGLFGEIKVQGSKNSVLPILAASILNKGITILHNCPKISDVENTIHILNEIGCVVKWNKDELIIDSSEVKSDIIPYEYAKRMRSSVIFAGAMLSHSKSVVFSYPGGCTIGKRPINWHLQTFEKIGIEVYENDDEIRCVANSIKDISINLDYPSVGVTENVILASVFANGTVKIFNYAKEPEIVELCEFLNSMGAFITISERYIAICGVNSDEFHDVEFTISTDRIVAGTYLVCGAAVGGDLVISGDSINSSNSLNELLVWLSKAGAQINCQRKSIRIKSDGKNKAFGTISTGPYPAFPTDMQPQMMAMASGAEGISVIIENVFEERFKTASELIKMGADITIHGNKAVIVGNKLTGASIDTYDLRSGAALVTAGLMAEGVTKVNNTEYIYRGYEDICRDLKNVGADIELNNT